MYRMGMKLTIGADAKPISRKKINLDLVGVEYKVNRIKPALAMQMARLAAKGSSEMEMVSALDNVIDAVFGDEAEAVQARLIDPDDALDYEHISELLNAMLETQSGDEENPTG